MENNRKQLRAAIYLRVSTDEQVLHYGLTMQEERLRSFVASQDYSLNEENVYKDEGFSGTLRVEERPALKRLFEAAERKEFDVVLVYRLDRFGRKILLILDAVERLAKHNVSFRSATEPFDTGDAFGRYLLSSLGALAELERETIKERTQGGRRIAAKAGRWVWGPPPYGYKLNPRNKRLEIVPEEAKWVKHFYKWATEECLSLNAIQNRANQLKVPCYKRRKRKKTELKGYWHKASIGRILSNTIYTGRTHFYKFKKGKKTLSHLIDKRLQNDEAQWVTFESPQIISQDIFDKCLEQRLKNRANAARNLKYDYLFNKLVYCGSCGLKLFGATKPAKNSNQTDRKFYHGTHNPKWQKAIVDRRRCQYCGDLAESRLEPIWDNIKDILQNPSYMLKKINKYLNKPLDKKDIREKLKTTEERLGAIIRKRSKINQVFLDSDSMDYNAYQSLLAESKKIEDKLRTEIKFFGQKLISDKESKVTATNIKHLHSEISQKLNEISYENKAKIIHLLTKKITVYRNKNEATVELNIPIIPRKSLAYTDTQGMLCNNRQYRIPLPDIKKIHLQKAVFFLGNGVGREGEDRQNKNSN